ncbi:MAG: hypothetical protein H6Q42_3588, partial [Deltaproteobacteria bacterium]|nr:hypothetical protein [Deltaproteobacteria bacterium]
LKEMSCQIEDRTRYLKGLYLAGMRRFGPLDDVLPMTELGGASNR